MKYQIFMYVLLLAVSSVAVADQATSVKSGCAGCHQMAVKTVGPAIKDIAAKLKGGNVDEIVAKVKSGLPADKLTWGKIPMPASNAPEADVRKVVEWMLAQ